MIVMKIILHIVYVIHVRGTLKATFQRTLPRSPDPAFNLLPSEKLKLIVIVCKFRSGSSFLGELFNQNPNILYDFETFYTNSVQKEFGSGSIIGAEQRHTQDELNMLLLQQTLHNCSIPVSVFINFMNKHWRCGLTPDENVKLFGTKECDEAASSWQGQPIKQIRRYHCLKRETVVLKVIRLRRIRDLEFINNIRQADIRVIHLVRDPRAMFRSRSGFKDIFQAMRHQLDWVKDEMFPKLGLEIQSECNSYLRDIDYAKSTSWLNGRYMLVKHDDLSINPEEIAEKIYKFVELPMNETVKHFIATMERNEDGANSSTFRDIAQGGTLNTRKNSREVLEKWLHMWKLDKIKLVDKHCAKFIKQMGWRFEVDASSSFSELA